MQMVSDEAVRNRRVPVSIALAVAKVESNFSAGAVSAAGARGVMQITPRTAMGEFGVAPESLMNPLHNVRVGIAYLERLFDRYGQDWELALSHYNGGNLRSADGRFVIHAFTRGYVDRVISWARSYRGMELIASPRGADPDDQIGVEGRASEGYIQ
ncbi:transglycosylase SLT domain-containing protein [Magnetospirillum moscoviense]|nr:transglycosylase SLT domain-containing protein [Magnetospirillum moscoviense]MBF0324499.1 transglycosylase SLT domain-containing protein [Alphaproteobacteria bacterium]